MRLGGARRLVKRVTGRAVGSPKLRHELCHPARANRPCTATTGSLASAKHPTKALLCLHSFPGCGNRYSGGWSAVQLRSGWRCRASCCGGQAIRGHHVACARQDSRPTLPELAYSCSKLRSGLTSAFRRRIGLAALRCGSRRALPAHQARGSRATQRSGATADARPRRSNLSARHVLPCCGEQVATAAPVRGIGAACASASVRAVLSSRAVQTATPSKPHASMFGPHAPHMADIQVLRPTIATATKGLVCDGCWTMSGTRPPACSTRIQCQTRTSLHLYHGHHLLHSVQGVTVQHAYQLKPRPGGVICGRALRPTYPKASVGARGQKHPVDCMVSRVTPQPAAPTQSYAASRVRMDNTKDKGVRR